MLTPADDSEPGRGGPDGAVAVISDGFWTRRFGRDPAVLGKSVQVGTQWVTIVGVTPPGFFGLQVGAPLDITLPMMLVEQGLQSKQSWWLSVIGRLAPGASVEAARADLEALWDAYLTEVGMPRDKRGYFSGIVLVPAARGANDAAQHLRGAADDRDGDRRRRAAHRLRQCGQPAARPRHREAERDGGAARDWRESRQADPSAADRRRRAGVAGSRSRTAVRAVGRVVPGCGSRRPRRKGGAGAAFRPARAGLYRRGFSRDGAALQPRAGAARDARRCRETRRCRWNDHAQPSRSSAGRRSSHVVGPPALRRRALSADASQPEHSSFGLRSRRRVDDAGRGHRAGADRAAEDSRRSFAPTMRGSARSGAASSSACARCRVCRLPRLRP